MLLVATFCKDIISQKKAAGKAPDNDLQLNLIRRWLIVQYWHAYQRLVLPWTWLRVAETDFLLDPLYRPTAIRRRSRVAYVT